MAPTPLFDSLVHKAEKNEMRMHMPGHKGSRQYDIGDVFKIDYTELLETGNLYEGVGPIAEAEKLMAAAAGADNCMFLAGGSTQGIMTALAYFCRPRDKVLCQRDLHLSAVNAMALLDLEPVFIPSEYITPFGINGLLNTPLLEKQLVASKARVVYITTPSYYGVTQDVDAISEICKRHGARLIADEAHGAHFPFIGLKSAAQQGADIAIASAHKTMPALGMAAMAYCSNEVDITRFRRTASAFGSSSPSYVILSSIDLARDLLESRGYGEAVDAVKWLREKINTGLKFVALDGENTDPARLVVCTATGGVSGHEASDILYKKNKIELEMADSKNIIAIFGASDGFKQAETIFEALISIPTGVPIETTAPLQNGNTRRMSIREAFFADSELVALGEAGGRIAAEIIAPYPPGIPIILPGEEIEEKHLSYFSKTSYNRSKLVVSVIKEA